MLSASLHPSRRFASPAPRFDRLILFAALLLPCGAAWAQETTGAIEGTVTGPDGKPLPDIVVVATMPATRITRSVVTGSDGGYRILILQLGDYEVAIQDPGYQPVTVKPVLVRLGRTTAVPPVQLMRRGELVEHVEVKGRPPVIDPVSTTIGGTVSAGLFDYLPVQRNYQSIATLLPGVSMSSLGDGLNIDGATGLENRYFVDGIEMSDPARGMGGTQLPPDFIQEVQVKTGGYEAEYRSALGGVVNVVTPSGSNQYSGKFIGYWTSHAVSRDPEQSSLELQTKGFAQYDAGFSVSGPLARDRAWFFVAYDPEYQTVETEIPGLGYYDGSVTTHRFSGKVDWQVNGANAVVLTIVGDPAWGSVVGQLPLNAPTFASYLNPDPCLGQIDGGGVGVSLRGTHVLGPDALLETSLSNLWREEVNLPATTRGRDEPLFVDAPTMTGSGGMDTEIDTESEQLTVTVKATWVLNQHELKAGAEYRRSKEIFNAMAWGSVTRYADDSFFEWNGEALGSTEIRIPSLYLQDSWRLGARWVLNAGLRWAREQFVAGSGETLQTIDDEWQPRLGFVYQPGRIGTQRIFGSAARFYQELATGALWNYGGLEGFNLFCSYDHDPRLDPAGGECLSAPIAPQPEVTGLRGNYFDEYALGYQLMLGEQNRAGVRAIYRSLGDTVEDGLVTETGSFVWGNPGRGALAADYPRASRTYKALELTFEGQPSARSGYMASYVWSENRGNYMGLWNTDFDYSNPNCNGSFDVPDGLVDGDGLLPNDRTHVFKASGFYRFEFGLSAGASIVWQSGTPLNEFGGSVYGPPFQTFLQQRGTAGRTPSLFDMNLRLDYTFGRNSAARWKPRLILDVYHLFSDGTPVDYDQIHYFNVDADGNQIDPNPTYGWVSRYSPPTTVRLGFELSF